MNNKIAKNIREGLTADCSKCFGLCCTALNIIASSDFPINKPAGTPCMNLQSDYSCQIHSQLREKGFKGCTVFGQVILLEKLLLQSYLVLGRLKISTMQEPTGWEKK